MFIEHEDPKTLVQLFVEELERRRALILFSRLKKSEKCIRDLSSLLYTVECRRL